MKQNLLTKKILNNQGVTSMVRPNLTGWIAQSCTAFAIACSPAVSMAQSAFPTHALTLVVPYGAGSTTDIYARVLAEGLGAELKQAVVVENRPGAGGTIGIGQALRASPDGYTMMLVATSSIAINGSLYSSLPFDPVKDISVVAIPSKTVNALIVPSSSKAKTFQEFAKSISDGGQHFYNSQGAGTSQHLSSVLLGRVLNAKVEHVPYKGNEGITGMLGGQTEFAFASLPSVLGLAKGDKLRILAVSGPESVASAPGVPTLASIGYKDFAQGDVWYGIGVNSKVPSEVKDKLASALVAVANNANVQNKLKEAGFDPMAAMTQEQRDTYIVEQVKFWSSLVRESGAKID